MNYQLLTGDNRKVLRMLPDQSVDCIVTSPPYFGLRDYGRDGQIGLEETPAAYVAELVTVFRECWRVLRDDGTVWLNLGDSYAANRSYQVTDNKHIDVGNNRGMSVPPGLKPKDLIGIPWRVAFALQDDGWYLRSDCIWHKPNPMPESVTDRPTKAHEYVFLLTKSQRYFYDADAVAEPSIYPDDNRKARQKPEDYRNMMSENGQIRAVINPANAKTYPTRNRRSVWTIATKPYSGAHFATMPPDLAEICVKAGCPEGGTVLDPFNGSGTTGAVACEHGRDYIGIDLNDDYIALAHDRIREAINASGRAPVRVVGKASDLDALPLFA